jgi:hypothetical protein
LVKFREYFFRFSPLGTASGLTHELPPAPGIEKARTAPKEGGKEEEDGSMRVLLPRGNDEDEDDDDGRVPAAWLARAGPKREEWRVFW